MSRDEVVDLWVRTYLVTSKTSSTSTPSTSKVSREVADDLIDKFGWQRVGGQFNMKR